MGVVDYVEEWLYVSGPGKQGKRCKADLKTLGWLAADQSEGRAQRFLLWRGQVIQLRQKGDHHLMEPGESQFHFRFDPDCSNNAEIIRRCHGVLQECGLSNARLTTKDELPAHPKPNRLEQRIQRCHLTSSIDELNRSGSRFARRRRCQAHPPQPILLRHCRWQGFLRHRPRTGVRDWGFRGFDRGRCAAGLGSWKTGTVQAMATDGFA